MYAECANVSKIALRKWSNVNVLTPTNSPLLLRIFGNRKRDALAIIPKIPPSAKNNKIGCGVVSQLTAKSQLMISLHEVSEKYPADKCPIS